MVKDQAILILAHTDLPHVLELSQKMASYFEVYIHFDQKCLLPESYKSKLKENGIHFIQEISVNWGSWSIAEAAIRLMALALDNPSIQFIHVISGQDWPIKPIREIYRFYENNSTIYMKAIEAKGVKKSGEPIILWQQYYFNYDKINRRTLFGKIFHRLSMGLQTVCRVNKFKTLKIGKTIYHGANWVDMPRDAAQFMLSYLDNHPNEAKLFKTGCFSDEFWMQTILCNEPQFSERIIKDNHRFIKWEKQHGSYPAILDDTDLPSILESDAHFARKLNTKDSAKLKAGLQRDIFTNTKSSGQVLD
ncbi:MAG TPA: glycosyltransferase [Bavariicoccus seileri]|uniref:Peptide O-xylosyltransferase n=1 Tax=Bavariicoccus seileri TaxID=549685 RepID=A0A3D4S563_9ENTE|nr:beta-1,6-N-acetylglucosaminyltransferase [Bavariicoccus seileri]HCS93728.1 glycosyltransferase [Bavariicoccus seileri]